MRPNRLQAAAGSDAGAAHTRFSTRCERRGEEIDPPGSSSMRGHLLNPTYEERLFRERTDGTAKQVNADRGRGMKNRLEARSKNREDFEFDRTLAEHESLGPSRKAARGRNRCVHRFVGTRLAEMHMQASGPGRGRGATTSRRKKFASAGRSRMNSIRVLAVISELLLFGHSEEGIQQTGRGTRSAMLLNWRKGRMSRHPARSSTLARVGAADRRGALISAMRRTS